MLAMRRPTLAPSPSPPPSACGREPSMPSSPVARPGTSLALSSGLSCTAYLPRGIPARDEISPGPCADPGGLGAAAEIASPT